MSKITYVSGGARSGKSTFAEQYALANGNRVLYIATAVPFDAGMKDRIHKHKERRPDHWGTLEAYKGFKEALGGINGSYDTLLFDCVTVMVTNLMLEDQSIDWDTITHSKVDQLEASIRQEFDELLNAIRESEMHLIIVSNELGMGIVPENRLSRLFRDIAGRMNQKIANAADEAYLIVSGQPLKLKG